MVDAEKQRRLFSMDDMVVVAAGGAGAIGSALARGTAQFGAKVAIADVSEQAAGETAAGIAADTGAAALGVALDVRDADSVARALACVEQQLGPVDVLINAVGTQSDQPAEEYALADWDRVMDLNLRGAFLHVSADTLGSMGAIIAGILIWTRGWNLADPVVSVVVGALVLYSSWKLVSESVDVLLEATPGHLDIDRILQDMGRVRGVVSVHDLHVWSISTRTQAMSCHAVMKKGEDAGIILQELSRLMREKYGIEHTTIQMEPEGWRLHGGDTLVHLSDP